MTAVSGGPAAPIRASRAASPARSRTSQRATAHRGPGRGQPRRQRRRPGAAGPDRLASTTRGAPRPASHRATCPPTAPVPPVTSTVPRGTHGPPAPRGQRRPHQPPRQDPGRPDRDLVLPAPGQHPAQPRRGPLVQHRRQVDQPAPPVRVLQRRHPAQAPHLRLHRAEPAPRGPRRHRAAGQHPQRRADPRHRPAPAPAPASRPARPAPPGAAGSGRSSSASSDTTPETATCGPRRAAASRPRQPGAGPVPGRRAGLERGRTRAPPRPASACPHARPGRRAGRAGPEPPAARSRTSYGRGPGPVTGAQDTGTASRRSAAVPAPSPPRRPGPGRLRPEPLVLERVGGQVHPPARRQHRGPVHRHPGTCAWASAASTASGPGASAAAAPARTPAPRPPARAAGPSADSVPSGPISTNTVTPCGGQRGHRVGEPDRLPGLPDPVPGVRARPPAHRSARPPTAPAARACASPAATWPSSASIGSIRGEWNAWRDPQPPDPAAPARRIPPRPPPPPRASPETTTDRGPFTAAIPTPPRPPAPR